MAHAVTQPEWMEDVAPPPGFVYGVIAEFEHAADVVRASQQAYDIGYRKIDAFTPFPVEGLSEALGYRDYKVVWTMFIAGVCGGLGGFAALSYLIGWDYPMNVGGRGVFPWPYFIPITFELTVLLSALCGIAGMLIFNGLPMPYHPVFSAPNFDLATSSRFFLCIEAADPQFDREETRRFMDGLGALKVSEVELRK